MFAFCFVSCLIFDQHLEVPSRFLVYEGALESPTKWGMQQEVYVYLFNSISPRNISTPFFADLVLCTKASDKTKVKKVVSSLVIDEEFVIEGSDGKGLFFFLY